METLLVILFWIAVGYLFMRSGSGLDALLSGDRTGPAVASRGSDGRRLPGWRPPEHDVDPVCGEHIRTAKCAKPTVYEGRVYYFCSRDCREIFEAAPDLYLSGAAVPQETEHSHA